jgi:hypothetical protein
MPIDKRFWHKDNNSPPIIVTIAFTVIAMLGLLESIGLCASPSRQAEVAAKGAKIMPFDLEQTMHHFRPLENGGLQTVTVKDPANSTQIALIQAHLKEEAEKFHRGDFSDPAKIHGENMPGLAALQTGAQHIDVQYTALPNGAQIRYSTEEPTLVTALHQWFAAQRADHGHHAVQH